MALPTILSNQPAAGFITWTAFGLQFDGLGFEIPAGNTNRKFAWWDYDGATSGGTATAPVTSVLTNGDFEEGFAGWSGAGALAAASTEQAYSGTQSIKCTSNGQIIDLGQTVGDVAPGEVWYAECWVLKTTAGGAGTVQLGATITGASTSYPQFEGRAVAGIPQGVWTKLSGLVTVPASGARLTIRPSVRNDVPAGTTIYVDRVRATKLPAGRLPRLQFGDALPDLAPEDCLLFLNRNGVGILAPTAQVVDGSLIVSGSIVGDAIAANQIDGVHVKANAIDTPHLRAGAVDADVLAAGAVTTEKLSVASVGNSMVANGSFEDNVEGWQITASGTGAVADVVTGVASSGSNALRLVRGTAANLHVGQTRDKYIPVTASSLRRWFVSCRAGAAAAVAAGFHLRVYWWQANRTTPASTAFTDIATNRALSTSWQTFEGQATVPANARYMQVVVINSQSGSTMYVDDIVAHEVVIAAMIGDGEVTAAKINVDELWANEAWLEVMRAGVIETSMLTAGFSQNLDLTANGAITLLAGQAAEQSSQITEQESRLAGVADQMNALGGQVGEVRSAADASAVAASAATAAARAAQEAVDTLTAYVRIDGTGLEVGSPGAATAVKITPASISLNVNGVPGAWIDAGQMIAPRFVGEEVDLANVKIQKQGNRTVVKAI